MVNDRMTPGACARIAWNSGPGLPFSIAVSSQLLDSGSSMSWGSLKLMLAMAVLPGGDGTEIDCRPDGSSVTARQTGEFCGLFIDQLPGLVSTAVSHQTPQRPALRLRWVGLGVFVITVATHIRLPLLADMGRDLEMSPAALGAFVAAFAFGRIVADIPAGRLTESRPVRAMLAIGAVFASVGSLIAGLSPIALVSFAAAFVIGVGSAWTNTTGIAAFAEAPMERRGVAMSGFAAALLVGQAVGPLFGGAIASLSDWRVAFLAGAALAGVAAVVLAWPRKARKTIHTSWLSGNDGQPVARPVLLAIYQQFTFLDPLLQAAPGIIRKQRSSGLIQP